MFLRKIIAIIICLSMVLGLVVISVAENGNQVNKILNSLTLEEKIAQMIMPAFRTWTQDDGTSVKLTELNANIRGAISKYGFGGIILFSENTQGTAQTAKLICDMQEAALSSRAGIPLLMSVDQEGGYVYRLNTGTAGCGNMALGAANDTELTKAAASIIAQELSAEGFNVDFAPDCDVNNNPANPVIGVRSFSDNPNVVSNMCTAYVAALNEANVISALKHFPGHGDTVTDSHSGLPSINKSSAELQSCELIPFTAGIKAGADVVMTAHIQYPQIEKTTYTSKLTGEEITLPATLSKTIINGILRNKLGFKGVVCTDAMNMGAIAQHFDRMDAARLAINAGVDILLMPVEASSQEGLDAYSEYINGIASMVRSGKISESTINAAVSRILKLKISRSIIDLKLDKDVQISKALEVVGSKANHDKEWQITQKTITLVKNNHMLPIQTNKNSNILFFAAYSNEATSMQYAVSKLKEEGVINANAKCEFISYTKLTSLDSKLQAKINKADAIIIDTETSGSTSYDPASASGWQAAFVDSLLKYSHEKNKKVAVISILLPYDIARYQAADAIVVAYNCKGMNVAPTNYNGETAAYGPNLPVAVAALFGEFIPSAKLPVNIYKIDSSYKYTNELLYPSGYGMSAWNASSYFTDIAADSSYSTALDWALENNITTGTSMLTFGPDICCSRAQIITFLWRAAGCPKVEYNAKFSDVSNDMYYAQAVSWAASKGIALGTSATTFSPNTLCKVNEIVKFIERYKGTAIEYSSLDSASPCTRAQAVQMLYENR